MSRDDERFRVRSGAPKAHYPRFITRVLNEMHKAGAHHSWRGPVRPRARIERGHLVT
jgi:hypothetical protein